MSGFPKSSEPLSFRVKDRTREINCEDSFTVNDRNASKYLDHEVQFDTIVGKGFKKKVQL